MTVSAAKRSTILGVVFLLGTVAAAMLVWVGLGPGADHYRGQLDGIDSDTPLTTHIVGLWAKLFFCGLVGMCSVVGAFILGLFTLACFADAIEDYARIRSRRNSGV